MTVSAVLKCQEGSEAINLSLLFAFLKDDSTEKADTEGNRESVPVWTEGGALKSNKMQNFLLSNKTEGRSKEM